MKDFALFFRMNLLDFTPSEEEMNTYMTQWGEWIARMEQEGVLTGGNHLSTQGKVISSDTGISDSPFTTDKIGVAGYLLIRTKGWDEAMEIAKKCPILQGKNTSVEVRALENSGN